jgi:hypothetical protein
MWAWAWNLFFKKNYPQQVRFGGRILHVGVGVEDSRVADA